MAPSLLLSRRLSPRCVPGRAPAILHRCCLALRNGDLAPPGGVVGPLVCSFGTTGAGDWGIRVVSRPSVAHIASLGPVAQWDLVGTGRGTDPPATLLASGAVGGAVQAGTVGVAGWLFDASIVSFGGIAQYAAVGIVWSASSPSVLVAGAACPRWMGDRCPAGFLACCWQSRALVRHMFLSCTR